MTELMSLAEIEALIREFHGARPDPAMRLSAKQQYGLLYAAQAAHGYRDELHACQALEAEDHATIRQLEGDLDSAQEEAERLRKLLDQWLSAYRNHRLLAYRKRCNQPFVVAYEMTAAEIGQSTRDEALNEIQRLGQEFERKPHTKRSTT